MTDESEKKATSLGRPALHTEAWSKITVVLLDRQIAFLDRLAADVRLKTGKAVSRAQIIRALIDFVLKSGIDLTAATTENEIIDLLLEKLSHEVPGK